MKTHFFEVTNKKKQVDVQKNEALKAELNSQMGVNRSNSDYKGASADEVAGWMSLRYK
jgi:hypothetical protein